MHAGRAHQRHGQHHGILRPAAVLAAALTLAGGTLLAGGPAVGADNSVAVSPGEELLSDLHSFIVFGTVSPSIDTTVVSVAFNGTAVGTINYGENGGQFQGFFNIPAGAAVCGTNTVTVTTAGNTEFGGQPVGSATITADCPAILVDPNLVGNQQLPAPFTVTPAGFPSGGGITQVTLDGSPQNFTTGGGAATFTASPGCGTHTVGLTEGFGEGATASASTRLTVLCPKITLSPSSIRSSSQPAPVQVTLTGFHSFEPVTITLGSASVTATTDGSQEGGRGGGLRTQITARGLACGANQATAAEQPNGEGTPAFLFTVSAPLQVTGCKPAGNGKGSRKATVAVNPVVVEPGMLTHVTGAGFAPHRQVTLTWQLPGGAPLPGTLTVTAGGDGRIDTYFIVMTHDQLGVRQLVATQGQTKATANAVVDGGPMEPSSGDRLIYRR